MQKFTAATVVTIAGLLAACGSPGAGTDDPGADWEAPAAYEYTLESSCGERNFLGRFHIVVRDDQVVNAEGLDERGRELLEHPEYRTLVPTLTDLLDEADQARADNADVVEVVRDDATGRPVRIDIDWLENATDDEACYEVSDYEATA